MSDMFCIITTYYLTVITDYLTIPIDHSYVATDDVTTVVWSVEQTIHLSLKMSGMFCIIATDYSSVATGKLTIPIDHLYLQQMCDLLKLLFYYFAC